MSFCYVGCCCCCLTLCRFLISRLLFNVTGTSPWFLQPMNASTSSELFPHYFSFLAFVILFFWLSFFSLKRFLPCTLFSDLVYELPQLAISQGFYQDFPRRQKFNLKDKRARSGDLTFSRCHTVFLNNTTMLGEELYLNLPIYIVISL